MGLNIVVCIKQVPDSSQIRIHPVTNTIMRQGVPAVVNPFDLYSLEAALQARDAHGGRVTVITMGPKGAVQALRKCLGYGADEAVLLNDRAFAGSDTLATSLALATCIRKLGESEPVDLVFCGKQTIDGDTAQVGPGIARRLGMQQLTYVQRIAELAPDRGEIVAQRRAEGGVQVLKTRLPALVTMLEGSNEIRFGSLDDMFRAGEYEPRVWSAADIGIEDKSTCGLKGSPTIVKKVFAPPPRKDKAHMFDTAGRSSEEVAAQIVELLAERHPGLIQDLAALKAGA